jgi:hypothetical protein
MGNPLACCVFPYGMPGSGKQFLYREEQAFVKVKEGVNKIVTENMLQGKAMDFGRLTALDTIIPL